MRCATVPTDRSSMFLLGAVLALAGCSNEMPALVDGGALDSFVGDRPLDGELTPQPTCTGSAATASLSDVGAAFHVVAGGTLTEVSTASGSSFLTYYDVPRYLPFAKRMLVNSGGNNLLHIVSMTPDGMDPQTLFTFAPCRGGLPGYQLSPDGRFMVYGKTDPATSNCDIYGIRLDRPGTCASLETRLTSLGISASRPLELAPPSLDATTGHYVVAFGIDPVSDDPHLYVVNDNGTNPRSPSITSPLDMTLDDPEGTLGWHRVRMNPRFPHLIFYRRQAPAGQPATRNYYVVDWSSSAAPHSVAWCDQCSGSHPTWTPDGRRTAIDGAWTEFDVVDASGKILPGLGIVAPNHGTVIGPFGTGDPSFQNVMYGSYNPDGTQLVVVTTPLQDPAGGRIFWVNVATGAVKFLSEAHSGFTLIKGQPRLGFTDAHHVVFSSDDAYLAPGSGKPPEVYVLSNFGSLP